MQVVIPDSSPTAIIIHRMFRDIFDYDPHQALEESYPMCINNIVPTELGKDKDKDGDDNEVKDVFKDNIKRKDKDVKDKHIDKNRDQSTGFVNLYICCRDIVHFVCDYFRHFWWSSNMSCRQDSRRYILSYFA